MIEIKGLLFIIILVISNGMQHWTLLLRIRVLKRRGSHYSNLYFLIVSRCTYLITHYNPKFLEFSSNWSEVLSISTWLMRVNFVNATTRGQRLLFDHVLNHMFYHKVHKNTKKLWNVLIWYTHKLKRNLVYGFKVALIHEIRNIKKL